MPEREDAPSRDEVPEAKLTEVEDEGADPGTESPGLATVAASESDALLNLMGNLYRGAMSRSTTWRTRLDRTSNWSVIIVATLLTWAFSTQQNPHSIILLGLAVLSVFLFIEARRYRMYDVWRSRVRLIEENVFADALDPAGAEPTDWRARLGSDLRRPSVKITLVEALARRLRRIYLALMTSLLVAWVVRVALLADGPSAWVATAGLGLVPGSVVVGLVAVYYVVLVSLAAWPMEREAKGRLRSREAGLDFPKQE
jgi:uncharacterized membrane protein